MVDIQFRIPVLIFVLSTKDGSDLGVRFSLLTVKVHHTFYETTPYLPQNLLIILLIPSLSKGSLQYGFGSKLPPTHTPSSITSSNNVRHLSRPRSGLYFHTTKSYYPETLSRPPELLSTSTFPSSPI